MWLRGDQQAVGGGGVRGADSLLVLYAVHVYASSRGVHMYICRLTGV